MTDPYTAAVRSTTPLFDLPSRYMLSLDTYVAAAELGFAGADYYVAGRGGALGEVPADVVTAAFVFFAPQMVTDAWARSGEVMSRADAARNWALSCSKWADANLIVADDAALRLAELSAVIITATNPAAAPSFGAWRSQSEPTADKPRSLALHRLMVLRELRGGLHGAASVITGLDPHLGTSMGSPGMEAIFGWPGVHPDVESAEAKSIKARAEEGTNVAMAKILGVLNEKDLDEWLELLEAVYAPFAATERLLA